MKLYYYGHSACMLETAGTRILIDPYFSQNPLSPVKPEEISADYIFVTHGHFDHLGDAEAIAKRCGATVCGIPELGRMLSGVNFQGANLGGWAEFPFGRVKMTPAAHSSGIPGGIACGFLFEAEGKKVYHAGDTALIADFALLGPEKVDVALLPIGGYYTMGIDDAVRAAEMIEAGTLVPMHYNTFPAIQASPEEFREKCGSRRVEILQPGGCLEL